MKPTKDKYLHKLFFIVSIDILLLYIVNPDFLVYNFNLFLNIVLVILLLLQLWLIIYAKKDNSINKNKILFYEILDLLVPIVSLYIGVNRLSF